MDTALKILAYFVLFVGFSIGLLSQSFEFILGSIGSFIPLLISAKLVEALDLYISYTRPLKRDYEAAKAREAQLERIQREIDEIKEEMQKEETK